MGDPEGDVPGNVVRGSSCSCPLSMSDADAEIFLGFLSPAQRALAIDGRAADARGCCPGRELRARARATRAGFPRHRLHRFCCCFSLSFARVDVGYPKCRVHPSVHYHVGVVAIG
eukprot:4871932-Pyramimonas_sp.AAC.1